MMMEGQAPSQRRSEIFKVGSAYTTLIKNTIPPILTNISATQSHKSSANFSASSFSPSPALGGLSAPTVELRTLNGPQNAQQGQEPFQAIKSPTLAQ
jgi:hypothetical protein